MTRKARPLRGIQRMPEGWHLATQGREKLPPVTAGVAEFVCALAHRPEQRANRAAGCEHFTDLGIHGRSHLAGLGFRQQSMARQHVNVPGTRPDGGQAQRRVHHRQAAAQQQDAVDVFRGRTSPGSRDHRRSAPKLRSAPAPAAPLVADCRGPVPRRRRVAYCHHPATVPSGGPWNVAIATPVPGGARRAHWPPRRSPRRSAYADTHRTAVAVDSPMRTPGCPARARNPGNHWGSTSTDMCPAATLSG